MTYMTAHQYLFLHLHKFITGLDTLAREPFIDCLIEMR